MIITPTELLTQVCDAFQEDVTNVKKKCREKELVFIRQIYYFFGVRIYNFALHPLSKVLDQDHTTAIHSVRQISGLLDIQDVKVVSAIKYLKAILEIPEEGIEKTPPEDQLAELYRKYKNLLERHNELKTQFEKLSARLNSRNVYL